MQKMELKIKVERAYVKPVTKKCVWCICKFLQNLSDKLQVRRIQNRNLLYRHNCAIIGNYRWSDQENGVYNDSFLKIIMQLTKCHKLWQFIQSQCNKSNRIPVLQISFCSHRMVFLVTVRMLADKKPISIG